MRSQKGAYLGKSKFIYLVIREKLFVDPVILYQTKRFRFQDRKFYIRIQALDSVSESLSSGVGRFVT